MSARTLDRLLVTLDVAVEAFAVCEIEADTCLRVGGIDGLVVHYVLEGVLHLTADDGSRIVAGPGNVIVVPSGFDQDLASAEAPTTIVEASDHCSMERDGMILFDAAEGADGSLRVVCGTIMASVSGSFGLMDKVDRPIAADLSDCALVRTAFANMLDEINGPDLGTRAMTSALMKVCLVLFLRRSSQATTAAAMLLSALHDPALSRAVAAILDAPAARHTVAELSAIAGMGRSTFARSFTKAFKMSPMQFVGKTRLHHSAQMLQSTTLPIKVIAASVGFASRSHFSRAFREAYGSDPSDFRKDHARSELHWPATLRGSRERFALSEEPA